MKRVLSAVLPAMLLGMLLSMPAWAKVDLVTLPSKDRTQVTIYNSADLTLVRESRILTLKTGLNRLQFSWAGTLIDPTSIELQPLRDVDKIHVQDLVYPPRAERLGVWNIQSEISGEAPFEITYFTSGLSWRAFYMGTLAPDEKTMRLDGYVRVVNRSGEDYENAQTRLIVGQVNILDEIAELAARQYPYGRPGEAIPPPAPVALEGAVDDLRYSKALAKADFPREMPEPKKIVKEGLSEYFLYTIEGTETIPDGWDKRLPSFQADQVPVVNLYKYEEERFGVGVVRFISFKNDPEHKLGETPIPGGALSVCRRVDETGRLSYEGRSEFKYIPVGEDVELSLGTVGNVVVEPTLMDYKTDRYLFDTRGDITGWVEIREYRIEVKNTRDVPVKIEIKRNFNTAQWELVQSGEGVKYEKVDLDTVKFTLEPPARSKTVFTYTLTTHFGQRAE